MLSIARSRVGLVPRGFFHCGSAELSCFFYIFHEQKSSVGRPCISCIAVRTETRFHACLGLIPVQHQQGAKPAGGGCS
jgi:hypothetical protein